MSSTQLHLSLKAARKKMAQLKVENARLQEFELEASALRSEVARVSERADEAERRVGTLQQSNQELAAEARRAARQAKSSDKRLESAMKQQKVDTKLVRAYKKRVEEHKAKAMDAIGRLQEEQEARGKAEALNEQLRVALERAGSQRLVDMHAHNEALKGAQQEAARIAALPAELKRERALVAEAHAARMQAEKDTATERALAEAAQGEMEVARTALEEERACTARLRRQLKEARATVKRMENAKFREAAAVHAMRRGGRGGAALASSAAPTIERGPLHASPAAAAAAARQPEPAMGLATALPSLEARSALRSTVASRIRSKGRSPGGILAEARDLVAETQKRLGRAERESTELKEDAQAAREALEAYETQERDMDLRRGKAQHAKEAVGGLRSVIVKEIFSRRRLHQLLANMRQQRLDHMRSLPPDPYRVPPEIIKGGPISYQRAVTMVQTRAKAWLTRRALAREAMAEEKRQQARADELEKEASRFAAQEEEFAGLQRAASQRVAETKQRLRSMSKRLHELEAEIQEDRARLEREQNAVAEAEAEVQWAQRQEGEVQAIHAEAMTVSVRSSLRAQPRARGPTPHRRRHAPDSAPAAGLRSFAARHRGVVAQNGLERTEVEGAAKRHEADAAFDDLFTPTPVGQLARSQTSTALPKNPWRAQTPVHDHQADVRRASTAGGTGPERGSRTTAPPTSTLRQTQSSNGRVPAAAHEQGSLFLGTGLGLRRSDAMAGIRQGGSAKAVLKQILAEREAAAARERKEEAKRRMDAELGLGRRD